MPDIHSLTAEIALSHRLADLAARESIRYFRTATRIDDKSAVAEYGGVQAGFDPVTAADRGAEQAIRDALAVARPEDGIDGEEFPPVNPEAARRWVIDPVDGTSAFVMGWPMWGTLIALAENGTALLGLMDQPFTRERFWSSPEGSRMRGPDGGERPLRTRQCASLAEATLSTTHPDYFDTAVSMAAFAEIKAAVRTTRYGGDCYAYAMLAAGFSDLIVESGLKSYDIAAHIPIVEGAGGVVTTWDGGNAAGGGNIVAAGDARVHEAALKLLSR